MKWERKTLDELGIVSRGKSKFRPRNDPSLFGGKYPFIQTADVKRAEFYITEFSETYNEKGLAQSRLWNKGTLCITIAANIADTAILGIDACFPDSIMGFVSYEDKSDVRFVKYLLDVFQNECKQISQGTAQDNLSWEKLSTVKFLVPDVTTQRRIANILSAYDDLIENNRKQIKLLEEAAQRLYKEWFVDLRFPGHEKVKVTDGVPEGWERIILSDLDYSIESGSRPKGGIDETLTHGVVSIGAENVRRLGEYCYSSEKLMPKEYYEKMKRGKIKDRDILIYKDGAYIGRTSLLQDNYPHSDCAVNEHVFLLHMGKEQLQYYIFFTLYQQTYFKKMQNMNKNSAQPGLDQSSIGTLDILLPTDCFVDLFNLYVSPIMKNLFILAKSIHILQEARDRLLPKLMSGEIEV